MQTNLENNVFPFLLTNMIKQNRLYDRDDLSYFIDQMCDIHYKNLAESINEENKETIKWIADKAEYDELSKYDFNDGSGTETVSSLLKEYFEYINGICKDHSAKFPNTLSNLIH